MANEKAESISISVARERFDDLVRVGALRVCERTVYYAADREDRLQEGLAQCWAWYRQQALLGRTPDTALVVHACKLRTVDRSRRFVAGDRARWRCDVFEQQGRGIELRRLDGIHDRDVDDDDDCREDPSLGIARLGLNNPEANLLSALDLSAWLESLPSTDREMLAMRGHGYGLAEIGDATGRSVAGVFRRARQLGYQLAERAGIKVMPTPHMRRESSSATARCNDGGGPP